MPTRNALPLEVLGSLAPILSRVEGPESSPLPQEWQNLGAKWERKGFVMPRESRRRAAQQKEDQQTWLLSELPTYSRDTVEEIITLAQSPVQKESLASGWRAVAGGLGPPSGYDLGGVFRKLFGRYFKWSGNEVVVREGRLEELHELALRFPVNHLLRRGHAEAVSLGFVTYDHAFRLPERLSLLRTASAGMRTVVDRGLTEGHLHLWGVASAHGAWADHLIRRLQPGALGDFSLVERNLLSLGRTMLRLLALALLERKVGSGDAPIDLLLLVDQVHLARTLAEQRSAKEKMKRGLWKWIRELEKRRVFPQDAAKLRWLLRLVDATAERLSRLADPVSSQSRPWSPQRISARIRLMEQLHFEIQQALVELEAQASGSPQSKLRTFLHDAFFRYLVYQTHHWQLATHSGRTTGLREFRRYFKARQRSLLPVRGLEVQRLIMEHLSRCQGVRNLEGRVSPPRRASELAPWLLSFFKHRGQLQKFGLVIHFIKNAAPPRRRRGPEIPKLRHGRIRRITKRSAIDLFHLLSRPHPVVPFIVGIDAASLELEAPPEVFAPTFRFLRELPIEVRPRPAEAYLFGKEAEAFSLFEKRRLRMTYHVAEDFRHLLSGLRAICEVVDFLAPQPGDRLGHAIALALDPERWAAQTGYQSILPKQEWLDTLVWVHHFLGPGDDTVGGLGIEDEIQHLSLAIYGSAIETRRGFYEAGWSPLTLYDSWKLRQLDPYLVDTERLRKAKLELRPNLSGLMEDRRWYYVQSRVLREVNAEIGSRAAYTLLGAYWLDKEVRKRGDQLILRDLQPRKQLWLKLCADVQEKLTRRLQERQLVIEVNPSSNRIIGPLAEFSDHHIFRLTLDETRRLSRKIRVTINTDDPGVFNTSLAHEYYLLGEILTRKGVPEAEVLEWLEWLRTNGHDCSFLHYSPRQDSRFDRLMEWLERRSQRLWREMRAESVLVNFWRRRQPRPSVASLPRRNVD